MQLDDSDKMQAAVLCLHKNQDNYFDTTLKGTCLWAIKFHSCRCLECKQHYYSFIGKAATGHWAISVWCKYLVGQHFFWLCNCFVIKEILEYTGNIHQVHQWSQELLGYHLWSSTNWPKWCRMLTPCPISMTPLLPTTTSQQINSTLMTVPSTDTPSDNCFSLLLPSTCQNIKKPHHQHHALCSWHNPRAGCPWSACLGTLCLVLYSAIWPFVTQTHPLLAPLLLPMSCATIVTGSPTNLLQAHWLTRYTAPWAPLRKNFIASPCHYNTSCIPLHQPYSNFPLLLVGTNFTCHCSNSPNQSIWFTFLCPTLTTLQSTTSIQCATILFLNTTTFSSTISTINSQLIPSWTISTHHFFSSQWDNNVTTFMPILVLTSMRNYKSLE